MQRVRALVADRKLDNKLAASLIRVMLVDRLGSM